MNKNYLSKQFVEEFLSYLKLSENKSPHTLSAYRKDINKYFLYRKKHSHQLFQEYLSGQNLSLRSQSRVISAVRSYFRFLEDQGCHFDFRDQLSIPVFKNKLPQFVTHLEFDRIIKASQNSNNPHYNDRNQLVLYLFFSLACRVSELADLNVQDYLDTDDSIVITGKGRKQRILPVMEPLRSYLRHYIQSVRPELDTANSPALILNNRGRRPSRVDLWRWIRQFCRKAGLTKSPHQFRHGCATELLDHGADLRSIQKLLGHASIETTKIYTHITQNKMKKEVERHHPLSKRANSS